MKKIFRSIGVRAGIIVLLVVLPLMGYYTYETVKTIFPLSEKQEAITPLKEEKIVKVKLYGSLSDGILSASSLRVKKGVIFIRLLKGEVRVEKYNRYVPLNPYQVLNFSLPGSTELWQMNKATEIPVKSGEIQFILNKDLQGSNPYTVVRQGKKLGFGTLEFAVTNLQKPTGKGSAPLLIKKKKSISAKNQLHKLKKFDGYINVWLGNWLNKSLTYKPPFDLPTKAREKEDIFSDLLPATEKTVKSIRKDYRQIKNFINRVWKEMEE